MIAQTPIGPVPSGAVLDAGRGSALLLLQGTAPGATARSNFDQTLDALSGYRVVAPDLIGFGASPNTPEVGIGPKVWREQAWRALDERGIERVTVLGNATGSRIALEMVHDQPTRVRGLVLLSTRIRPSQSPAQTLLRDYRPDELSTMRRLITECFVTDQFKLTDEVVRLRFEASARPGAQDAMQRAFASLRSPGLTDEQIAGVASPALLLHGRNDRVVPWHNSVELARLLPHADLHVLGDVGHWLQIERASEVNQLITTFLGRLAD